MSNEQVLVYWLELGGVSYATREVRGIEGMSTPFRFEIKFALEAESRVDPDALIFAMVGG